MKKVKLFFTAMMVLLASAVAMAQNVTVTGTVTDKDGNPLIGAAVMVNGTTTGVATGTDGSYSLTVPGNASLLVTMIGYADVIEPVRSRTLIDFVLEEDTEYLDEITVVAFGTKRKQDLVGSVSTVKSSIVANSQATSVTNALEGAVAGLQVISSTGQPGTDANIYVRGIGSLSASNAALIVVDGVPFNGKLSDINPNDIESITVSKDAVSNSLYGSRAAGGVVMVTTKKGSPERISIQFQGNWGVTSRAYKDYNMVSDPGEFYELTWYGIRNTQWAGGASLDDAALYASQHLLEQLGYYNAFKGVPSGEYLVGLDGTLNPNAQLRYDDTFYDAMFKNSFRQEYNVSASGGNDRTDYYLSLGYLDNESYIIGSSYDRFSARVNVNSQLKKWVKVGTNIGYSRTTQNGVQEGVGLASNPFSVARSWAPIFPVHAYDADGNMKYNPDGTPMYDSGMGETDGTTSRPTATNQNVITNLYEDINERRYNNLTSRSYIEIKFLKDFTFSANYSYDYTNLEKVEYYTPTIGDGMSFGGRGNHGSYNTSTTNFNQILAYDKIVDGKHYISAKIGHEYYKYRYKSLEGEKTNFFDPMNPELVNGGQMQSLESYTLNHNIEGYFAMADYNFSHRYYISAAFRRDGTSRFRDRWGNFWSVGAAWRISGEKFAENASGWLNDLKLRASYGTQGNENILPGYAYGYTPYQDQYSVTWDGSALGYTIAFYGNPDLTWEKQKTFDVGLDFRLWDRLYGNVDYFIRRTDDMLFQRPLATSAGRPYNWENIGSMNNSGVEFEVNVDIFKRDDLRWTVSLVGSHYENKILTLPEENRADGITSGPFNLREGKSRYEYYTYMYAGMNELGQGMWYMDEVDEAGNPTGNKVTTTEYQNATKYFIGKTALPDINGGLNTTFYFKGIDLSIATAFQIGGWAYDYSFLDGMSSSYYTGHNVELWDTFNPETGTGKYPIWNANDASNSFTQTSDLNLVKASYFSIRNITLGYSFPRKWMDRIKVQNLRVYVTADNLALWSARQGFDPRVSMSGSNDNFGGYSPMKVISGGINITF